MKYLLIVLCGGAGSLARYLVGTAVAVRYGSRFPWGTLAVNVTGSFLIGLIMTLLTERVAVSPNWRFALVVGFLGGYTTFSSFEWETFAAVREGAFGSEPPTSSEASPWATPQFGSDQPWREKGSAPGWPAALVAPAILLPARKWSVIAPQ